LATWGPPFFYRVAPNQRGSRRTVDFGEACRHDSFTGRAQQFSQLGALCVG